MKNIQIIDQAPSLRRRRFSSMLLAAVIAGTATVGATGGVASAAYVPAPCTINTGSANVHIRKLPSTYGKILWTAPKNSTYSSAKGYINGGKYKTPAGNTSTKWVKNVSGQSDRFVAYNWVRGPYGQGC